MRRLTAAPAYPASQPPRRKPTLVAPQGLFTSLVMRPPSDLFLWLWRLERRLEFPYRPQFDKRLRPPLFDFAQKMAINPSPQETPAAVCISSTVNGPPAPAGRATAPARHLVTGG